MKKRESTKSAAIEGQLTVVTLDNFRKFESAMFDFVSTSRQHRNFSLTKRILQAAANSFGHYFGVKELAASDEWFSGFLARNNIVLGQDSPQLEKKGVKRDLSGQKTNPPDENEEFVVTDVDLRCDGSSEMETQRGASANLNSDSDVDLENELIDVGLESSAFDNLLFHSSIVEGPSELQFDRQTPSTYYRTQSDSSNSNSGGQVCNRTTTLSHELNTVKIKPHFSMNGDKRYEKNDTAPSVVSVAGFESPSRVASFHPTVPSHPIHSSVLNITGSENSSSVPNQIGIPSPIQSPSETSNNTNQGSSYNSPPIHSKVIPRPRDSFDTFGEYIASRLRNLDPESNSYVQTAFADILLKVEIRMFKSSTATKTNYVQREAPSTSSGKENVQPIIENPSPNLNIPSSNSLSRCEPTQPRIPPLTMVSSFQPVFNNTSLPNLFMNEVIRPPPVPCVAIPESPFSNNPIQTGIPFYTIPPFPHPNLQTSYMPIQASVPYNMQRGDEFYAFSLITASKLRNLDPRSCAFVQKTIADLIFEAELGRFLSNREKSIFAKKTRKIKKNMPPGDTTALSLLKNVVSNISR